MKKSFILAASLLCTSLGWSDDQEVNLALYKPTEQSSTAGIAVASRAVDGNTDGVFSRQSITHTHRGSHPWWQVDLEESVAIENIVLHNRTDCCASRLSAFWVFASNQPFGNRSFDELLNDPNLFKFESDGKTVTKRSIQVANNGNNYYYRYIRVQSKLSEPLSIAEVEVFPRKPNEKRDTIDLEALSQYDVGYIPVNTSVSPDGSATVNISIPLPAAPQNAKPSLSMNYNSHIYSGNMGQGWNLSGVSSITRCNNNEREDHGTRTDEQLCLDGEKIYQNDGNSWNSQHSYHTLAKRQQKITSGEGYFIVTDQQGNESIYGDHRDNDRYNNTGNFRDDREWRLSFTRDTYGNMVLYQYDDAGRITSIYYNNHNIRYSKSYNSVEIYYNSNGRIRSITVEGKNKQFISRYQLSYNFNNLLSQIKQCSATRESGCVPPVTLSWENFPQDINGDGELENLSQLTHITNQLNVNTSFEYARLNDDSVYLHRAAENDQQQAVQGEYWVVKSLSREDGQSGLRQENYAYSGLKFDSLGTGSLGFKTVKSYDVSSNLTTLTTYEQSYALRGVAQSVEVFLGDEVNGTRLQNTQHQYKVISEESLLKDGHYVPYFGDQKQYFTYLKKSYTAKYDHNGNILSTRLVENDYPHGEPRSDRRIRINGKRVYLYKTGIGSGLLERTKTIHLDYELSDPFNFSAFDTTRWGLEEEINYSYKPAWRDFFGKVDTLSYVATINRDQSTRKTKTTQYKYDEHTGQVTQEISEPGNQGIVHTYRYNRRGQIIRSERYAEGDRCYTSNRSCRFSVNEYDEDGTLSLKSNSLNHKWLITDKNQRNQPTRLIDANNNVESRQYDAHGRIVLVNKAGVQRTKSYNWCFDSAYCQPDEVYFEKMSIEGQMDSWIFFDKHHREIRRAVSGFDGRLIQVKEEFDALGRLTQKSNPFYEGDIPDWTRFEYDEMNRVSKMFVNDSLVETNEYTHRSLTTTNAKGQQTIYEYNVLGKPVVIVDALNLTVSHEYDALGYIVKTTHPSGMSTFGYDNHHRVIWADEPTAGRREHHYDVFGARFLSIQQDGTQTCTATDRLNRKTKRVYGFTGSVAQAKNHCSGNGTFSSAWAYDESFKGKMSEATSSQGVTQRLEYDNLGRQIQHTQIVEGESIDLNYQYDRFGRMKSIHYPGDVNIEYVYNSSGYLYQVTNQDTGVVYSQNNALDAAGNVLEKQYFNGMRQTQLFSGDRNWLLEKELSGGHYDFESIKLTMDYDVIGNLASRRIEKNHTSVAAKSTLEAYEYDSLNRLTNYEYIDYHPDNSYFQSFSYHQDGSLFRDNKVFHDHSKDTSVHFFTKGFLRNHPSITEPCVSASGAPNALAYSSKQDHTGESFTTHCYDDRGNMVKNDQQEIEYSAFNKPTQITLGTNRVSYVYGPNLEKVAVTNDNEGFGTKIMYFGAHLKETYSDGANSYVLQVADDVTVRVSSRINAYVTMKDHQGTLIQSFYESSSGFLNQNLDPWGSHRVSNIGRPNAALIGYTGHHKGDSLPLIHMGGRIYSPELKRFLSVDPFVQQINNSQNYNRYSYVLNNPTGYTDPTGYKFFHKAKHGLSKFGHAVKRNLPHSTAGWVMFSIGLAVAPGFVLTEMAVEGAACTSGTKTCQTTQRYLMGINGGIEIAGAVAAGASVCVVSAGTLCAAAAVLTAIAVTHGVDSIYAASSGNTMFETKGLEEAGMSQRDAELTVQAVDLGANLGLAGLGSIAESAGAMYGESSTSDGFNFSEAGIGEPTIGQATEYELPMLPDRLEGEREYDSPNARQIYHLARFYEKGSAVLYSGDDYQLFMNDAGAVDEGYSVMHFNENDTWSPEVNRALIDGQLARGAKFVSASPVDDASLANENGIRVFGQERDQIARAGYQSNGTEGILGER